jgi:hypothetical protein
MKEKSMTQTEKIQDALDHADLPDWIARREVELIEDATGDRAARISLIVKDGNDFIFKDGGLLNQVSNQIHQILDVAQVNLWPYVSFIAEAEA